VKLIDMSGQNYGELTILSCAGRDKRGQVLWRYKCSCGREGIGNGYSIRSGGTKTCGHCYLNSYDRLDDYGITVVTLQNGMRIAVSCEDESWIKRYGWFVGGNGYVVTSVNGKRKYLHKMIMGVDDGTLVDHINRDKTDNRRSNLRIADKSMNAANAKLRRDSIVTGHKNVKFDKRHKNYAVRVTKDGVTHYGGAYKDLYNAIIAANAKRVDLFGEFAYYDSYIEPLVGNRRSGK